MKRNKNPSGSSDEEKISLRQKRAKKESQGKAKNVQVDIAETDEDGRVDRSVRNAQANDHNRNVKEGMDGNIEETCDDNLPYDAHSRVKTDDDTLIYERNVSTSVDCANNPPTHEFANAEDVNDRARVSYQYGEDRNECGTNHFDARISNANDQNFSPELITSPQSVYNHPKSIDNECERPPCEQPQHKNRHDASGNSKDVGESSHSHEFSSSFLLLFFFFFSPFFFFLLESYKESQEIVVHNNNIGDDGHNYSTMLRERGEACAVSDINVENCETVQIECAEVVIGSESDDDGDHLEQFRNEINMDDGHEGDDEEGDEEWDEGADENEEWEEGGDENEELIEGDHERGNEGGDSEHDNVEEEEYDEDADDEYFLYESEDDSCLNAEPEDSFRKD